MLMSFKTEINPTEEQKTKINKTLGVCRFVHNLYVDHVDTVYKAEHRFVNHYEFSKYLNNEYRVEHPEHAWIRGVSSKAVRTAIIHGDKAFKNFFNGLGKHPRFKRKGRDDSGAHFARDNVTDFTVKKRSIKITTLGFVKLKEHGYIPVGSEPRRLTVTKKAGRYYVSALIDVDVPVQVNSTSSGLGVDLGLKDFAVVSDGRRFGNINRAEKLRKFEKNLRRQQRRLSRKFEALKVRGKSASRQNIRKQTEKLQKLHVRLANQRSEYLNHVVNQLTTETEARTKPGFIVIEDLNVKGMLKNRHLSRAISKQGFFTFRQKLTWRCLIESIELRVVSRWFPSSKTCSRCGHVKRDLKLKDRTYICPSCGLSIDRDLNATYNLRDCLKYVIA